MTIHFNHFCPPIEKSLTVCVTAIVCTYSQFIASKYLPNEKAIIFILKENPKTFGSIKQRSVC